MRAGKTPFSFRKRYLELRRLRGTPDLSVIEEDPVLDTSMTYLELKHMVSMLEVLLAYSDLNIMNLQETVGRLRIERTDLAAMRELLMSARHERDEACRNLVDARAKALRFRTDCAVARRWLCSIFAKPEFVTGLAKPGDGSKYAFAKEHGWDCFPEK